jgi:hypothetical protein
MYIIAQAPSAAGITLNSGAATAAFNVIAGEPGAGTQCNLNAPGSNKLNAQSFTVRAAGNVVLAAGTYTTSAVPVQIFLNCSNTASFAAASGNQLLTSTSIAAFTWTSAVPGAIDWQLEGHLVGDNSGAKVGGYAIGSLNDPNGAPTATAPSVVSANSPSSVNYAAEPPLQFTVSVRSAASNLLNSPVANLTSFVLEA